MSYHESSLVAAHKHNLGKLMPWFPLAFHIHIEIYSNFITVAWRCLSDANNTRSVIVTDSQSQLSSPKWPYLLSVGAKNMQFSLTRFFSGYTVQAVLEGEVTNGFNSTISGEQS